MPPPRGVPGPAPERTDAASGVITVHDHDPREMLRQLDMGRRPKDATDVRGRGGHGREIHEHERRGHDHDRIERRALHLLRDDAKDLVKSVKKGAKRLLHEADDDKSTRREVRKLFKSFRSEVRDVVKSARKSGTFDVKAIGDDLESAYSSFMAGLREALGGPDEGPGPEPTSVRDADAGTNGHEPPVRTNETAASIVIETPAGSTTPTSVADNAHEPPVRTDDVSLRETTSVTSGRGRNGHEPPTTVNLLDRLDAVFRRQLGRLLDHLAAFRTITPAGPPPGFARAIEAFVGQDRGHHHGRHGFDRRA